MTKAPLVLVIGQYNFGETFSTGIYLLTLLKRRIEEWSGVERKTYCEQFLQELHTEVSKIGEAVSGAVAVEA